MRRTVLVVAAVALAAVTVACIACSTPSTGGGAGGTNTVTLQNIAFNPSTLTVKPGDRVTFKNADSVDHHVVVGTDDLGIVSPGTSVMWTAGSDGVYTMKCLIHPSMVGQITVGAGGSTIGTAPSGGGSSGSGYGY